MARNGSIKGTNQKREAEGGCSKTQPYCRCGKMSELLNTRKLNQRMETESQETETSTDITSTATSTSATEKVSMFRKRRLG
jgi:hypothetical protein